VDAALRTLRERPLMVAAFGRPEMDDRFPGLWNDRDVQRMSLAPMTPRSANKLVRHMLADLPEERAAWIVERADGNPFYLEELVRAVSAGHTTDLPDTVMGMVQARFDAVGMEAKRILRAGAIFGQTFRPSGVRALVGDQDRSLDRWLDILAQKEIVFPRHAADTRVFSFRHALMQEAAYGMLTPADRVRGHRLAGEFLESQGEQQAIVLVDHYEKGEQPAKAAHWCRFAVQQALDANDLAEVLARVDRGVRLGAGGEQLGIMRTIEAQARYWRGEYARAEQAARQALNLVQGERRFAALGELINALGQLARFDEVIELTEEMVRADPGEAAPDAWLTPLLRSALNLFPSGRTEVAGRILSRIEDRAGRREICAGPLHVLRARVAAASGQFTEARAHFEAAVEAFEKAGDVRFAASHLADAGWLLGEIGLLEEAARRLREAAALAERLNLSNVVLASLTNLAQVELHLGRVDASAGYGERANALAAAQGDWRFLGFTEWHLASIAHLRSQFDLEEAHARAAARAFEHVPQLASVGQALLARARLGQGRTEEAVTIARRAAQMMEDQPPEDGEALIRLVLGEAFLARGEVHAAAEVLDEACRRLHERARSLGDAAARESFLGLVPDHARTIALAKQHPQKKTPPLGGVSDRT
jgi:tetratricopeptide (TPR) repeat protein